MNIPLAGGTRVARDDGEAIATQPDPGDRIGRVGWIFLRQAFVARA
ncbi:MAG: hypothetical protein ACKO3N_03825 [Verrucomicrobiota bacterium]